MKYYKNEKNEIFGYDADQRVPAGLNEVSQQEHNNIVNPKPPEKTTQNLIDELETSITKRNLIGFLLGDQFAIDKVTLINSEINSLRDS